MKTIRFKTEKGCKVFSNVKNRNNNIIINPGG